MTSKSKKDKIKQGNQKDFDLLYDVLVSGGTYSDYKSELLDRSMPQEQLNFDISEDDVLAAWILGKDEESELYARGGHIHSDGDYASMAVSTASKTGPWGLFISAGDNTGDILQGISTQNFGGGNTDDWYDAIYGKGGSGFASRILGLKDEFNNAADYIKNYRNQYSIGDNASLYNLITSALNLNKSTSNAKLGSKMANAIWQLPFTPDPLLNAIIGYKGDFGIAKLFGYDPEGYQKQINQLVENLWNLNIADQNTAIKNSQLLSLNNQLSQPYMAACGGKMKNRLASGGYINSHYDYITDPLVKVDAGGTHQENPNEGVLTSIAPDGQPNLVEEGETIINNQDDAYVFSDRIVADDEILKSHLLPNKFAGKTYADISKELDKIIEEHKNDEISKRTFDEMISRLQQAQEDQKFQEKQEEVEKFLDGLTDEQKEQLEQTMVEEAEAEQQAAEEQAVAEQQAQELAALEQQMQPEQAPEQVDMEQPEEQIVPSRYDQMMSRALFADAANQGMFGLGGHLHQLGSDYSYQNPVTPEMRRYVLEERNRAINTAHEQGLPYYEEVNESPINEFFTGRKLRRINPDGTETIINNAYIGKDGNPVFLMTGIAPAPSSTRPAAIPRSAVGKTNDIKNAIEVGKRARKAKEIREFEEMYKESGADKRAIEELKRLSNANDIASKTKFSTSARKATKIIKDSENTKKLNWFQKSMIGLGIGNAVTWPITIAGFANIDDEEENDNVNSNQKVDMSMMKNQQNFMSADKYLTTPQSYYDSAYREFMTGYKHQPGGPLYDSKKIILLLQRTPYTPIAIDLPSEDNIDYTKGLFYNPNLETPYTGYPMINPVFDNTETNSHYNNTGYINNSNNSNNSIITIGRWSSSGKYAPGTTYSGLNKKDKASFDEYYRNLQPVPDLDSIGLSTPEEAFDKLGPRIFGNTNNTTSTVTTDNNNTNNTGNVSGTTRDYSTWLRYAPAVGSGIQYLSDLFGVTNRNNFHNADLYQRSINAIPNVGFTPLGNYMTYSPLDETYQQNVARSQYNAARRAIQNNASGNASAALAAMDSLNGNMNNTFGDLALQAREYNDKQREAVEQFNANIARINSMMSLSTQEKNQAIAAEKARLTYNLANMRENIQNMNDAAKSANENAFYSNLGAIGKENFNMQMVRTNPAFYYTIMSDGSIVYKNGFYDLNKGDLDFITADAEKAQKEQLKKNSEDALKKSEESKDKEEPIWFNRYYGRNYLNPYIGNSYLMPLNFNTRIGG